LAKLKFLNLLGNKIVDITPLVDLTNLIELNLSGNRIQYIKPLSRLTKLTKVNLQGNRISQQPCPIQPESICDFLAPASLPNPLN
jgi:internalin A